MKPSRFGGTYDPRPGATGPGDPGGGDYDSNAEMKIRDWYYDTAAPKPEVDAAKITIDMVLDCWIQLELDLHERFGIDVESGVLDSRTWRWFQLRIAACVGADGHLRKALHKALNTPSNA